jgi:PAS domain S-box-containing protein
VLAITVARDGGILFYSYEGIDRYKNEKWENTLTFTLDFPATWRSGRILETSDGSLWAGLPYGALRIKNGRKQFYTTRLLVDSVKKAYPSVDPIVIPESIPFDQRAFDVYDIMERKNGDIWFTIYEQNTLLQLHGSAADPRNPKAWTLLKKAMMRSKMTQTHDGKVWLINDHQDDTASAPWVYDPAVNTWSRMDFLHFGGTNLLFSMAETGDGTLLFGGLGKITAYKDNRVSVFNCEAMQIATFFRPIMQMTSDSALWVAGYLSDVYRVDASKKRWTTHENINFQCESGDGAEWFISADDGAVCRRGTRWFRYGTEDGLIDSPQVLKTTSDGVLWAAGGHQGQAATAVFDGRKWIRTIHKNVSWSLDYRSFLEAADGSLWFGAAIDNIAVRGDLGGILKYDPRNRKWTHFVPPAVDVGTYGLGQTPDGQIWSVRRYVNMFNGINSVGLTKPRELEFGSSDCIQITPNGHVWIGTRNYGIFHYHPGGKSWKKYDMENGLPGNSINSILCSSDTTCWAATEKGIGYFDGTVWTGGIFPPQTAMDTEGGSLQRSSGGTLWINKSSRAWHRRHRPGTIHKPDGGARFYTIRYNPIKENPETWITTPLAGVAQRGNTGIAWTGKDLWGYTPREKLQYSFRLDGKNWSPFSATSSRFFSLKSGKHMIEVRARDLDMNVDPTPAAVTFKVSPPVWRHPLVVLLVALLLIVGFIYEKRVLKHEKVLNLANAELSERTRELDVSNYELEQANRFLKDSEEEYRTLFEMATFPIFVLDSAGVCINCNEAVLALFQCTKSDLTGRNIESFIKPHLAGPVSPKKSPWKTDASVELKWKESDKIIELTFIPAKFMTRQWTFVVGKDITERKLADKQIKTSLREKELLLKEIHHRVKNNLQVIKSLLRLQAGQIEDPRIAELFQECQNRIQSMAFIHERLYKSDQFSKIDFAEYIRELVDELYRSMRVSTKKVALDLRLDNVMLGIDQAVPCGLIVNEMVTNALKHAFPPSFMGENKITISLKESKKHIALMISDNGAGIPADIDVTRASSLGLHLIALLSQDQLNGELELKRDQGTAFNLRFKAG